MTRISYARTHAEYSFQSPRSGKFESNENTLIKKLKDESLLLFQSPRSGKFESNESKMAIIKKSTQAQFQSPRSGKFESNSYYPFDMDLNVVRFQSPRSGKFESNLLTLCTSNSCKTSFNPLDRGNLNQI